MTIPPWFAIVWLIAAIVTPLFVVIGVLWLRRAFVTGAELKVLELSIEAESARISAVDEEVCRIDRRLLSVEGRCGAIEERAGEPPSRTDLSKDIGKVAERVRGVEVTVDAVKRMVETSNQYLHTIIEQGMRK